MDVLISQVSNQFDFNLELTNSTSLILNFGLERIIGNHLTGIGDSNDSKGAPVNIILNRLKPNNSIFTFIKKSIRIRLRLV